MCFVHVFSMHGRENGTHWTLWSRARRATASRLRATSRGMDDSITLLYCRLVSSSAFTSLRMRVSTCASARAWGIRPDWPVR